MNRWLAIRLVALSLGAALVAAVSLVRIPDALACGCFTPPDPSVPIVQAGERIAFQIKNGRVTAHIQIQYSGPAEEFGWLLPLPSEPTLEVGTDELFQQLIQQTQPLYRLQAEYRGNCPFDPSRQGPPGASGGDASAGGDGAGEGDGGSPLVVRDTVGPYDYAVLRADSKDPMLEWLDENGFFVPAGTDEAVDPYIREGAFFLALKLRKGSDVGDIQPVVVDYASDLPMIPIVLTGVAADPNMPVMVWVLGKSRGIPRNYFHTLINDAEVDWLNAGANYIDVINKAVDEADEHHSFVTEYAGTSAIMQDILDYPGRFGDLNELRSIADAVNFVEYLNYSGYTANATVPGSFGPTFNGQVLAILQSYLPVPAKLLQELTDQGQTAGAYYQSIRYYVEQDRLSRPDFYEDLDLEFDPAAMTDELDERVVTPTLAAGQLFRDNPYMTRMFTTMSPDEMTRDPVFSFNADLPEVGNQHTGRLIYYCGRIPEDTQTTTPAKLITEDGWVLNMPNGTGDNPWIGLPWPKSQFIQMVREEGAAQSVVDNTEEIASFIEQRGLEIPGGHDNGCSVGGGSGAAGGLGLGGLLAFALVRRRRR
ncbi:MAG TPA: DUF2330 domain-containing protein [Kofleriaceae bacterium]|nr:DUF2330 domain-containing protein [Kofleriaceae bacterium]